MLQLLFIINNNIMFRAAPVKTSEITLFNVSKAACAATKAGSAFSRSSAHTRCFIATSCSINITLSSSSAAVEER